MRRSASTFVLVAALAVLAAVPVVAIAESSAPQAGAARKCPLTRYEQDHLGTTYVLTLRVSGTRCANGKKVVRAYHRCRRANGGRDGRCRSPVYGYRCSERRLGSSPEQYDARARCKKAGREIMHLYTQNL